MEDCNVQLCLNDMLGITRFYLAFFVGLLLFESIGSRINNTTFLVYYDERQANNVSDI